MVVYLSDRAGWSGEDDRIVQALRSDGSVVLGVDLSVYAKALDADDGECLYVVGEITDLAQTAQRQLGIQTYLPPIVAGRGEGATFAYAALADAPANTLGGAVAAGFENRLTLRLPFCPGATATKSAEGYSYAYDIALSQPAVLLVAEADADRMTSAVTERPEITVDVLDPADTAGQVASAVSSLVSTMQPFGDLPAIDLPSATPARAVAILVSGDGGWRDLDKTIGEWLSTQGIHVVGLDALRYFWSRRTPEELARDTGKLLRRVDPKGALPVMLIGYSFGADTIPFAFPLLPKAVQDRTRVIALMAPGLSTSFQVTISGWLGIDDSGYDIPPAVARLPAAKVVCVYGKEETDTACLDPALNGMAIVATEGGHHFDGDYESLARRFLDRLGSP
jgi:type IV secretory pathway VirJ component